MLSYSVNYTEGLSTSPGESLRGERTTREGSARSAKKAGSMAFMIILSVCLSIAGQALAAEVINLKSMNVGGQLVFDYDLVGGLREKEACIEASMILNDKKYSSNEMSLSGDFGRSVKLGTARQIVWKSHDDFPQGLTSAFKVIVNVVPGCEMPNEGVPPSEGFAQSHLAINRQTVVDIRTNLMWTRNANTYENPVTYSNAKNLIEKINQERYAGYNDWRMPTREEFETLMMDGKEAGWGKQFTRYIADFLRTCGFKDVQLGYYWTSTTSRTTESQAFTANGWNGSIRPLEKTNYYFVWPVRSSR